MSIPTPDITLHFLQASRSIRVAWLLEELQLPYKNVFYPRENNKAPAAFKEQSGNALGKAPVLKDGQLTVMESGAITEYLIETYDPSQRLLGGHDPIPRNRIRAFIHAAEGTFMPHALAVTYARWNATENMKNNNDLQKMEEGLYVNVVKDLQWIDAELEGRMFLGGESVTAADTMCAFSVQFILARGLGGKIEKGRFGNVEGWLQRCEGMESWKRAVKKTGYEI
ncbi:related to GTT1-glutathione S-transferase [Rhynchosporium secalis]|uniref:Related to GTT1-glutathione S-transferase n=1 Tax=Rhynchosporium secalis TaxID=38038 RepID=A0A1E1MMG3_RHYSE|nr:related to GTT1-glutathione S-transferase [Rhynchosporium secalis]